MNRVVENINSEFDDLGEIRFNSQEEILEAHQVMINQLRDNIIKLARQNTQLYALVEKLYNTFEANNMEIAGLGTTNNDD